MTGHRRGSARFISADISESTLRFPRRAHYPLPCTRLIAGGGGEGKGSRCREGGPFLLSPALLWTPSILSVFLLSLSCFVLEGKQICRCDYQTKYSLGRPGHLPSMCKVQGRKFNPQHRQQINTYTNTQIHLCILMVNST